MPDKAFCVTTPIYYVNDIPHIGHSYTTIAADVLARYHRLLGDNVHFLTGTDEHGMKVQRAAAAAGETPKELADRVVARSKALWERLDISNDDFIRTTQPRHERVVQLVLAKLQESGDLRLGEYAGWYCTSCENFLAESDLADGNCPDCGKKAEWASEPTYFFRMSAYGEKLLAFLDAHPNFVRPPARFNEVRNRVAEGLRDVSFTRTSVAWGVSLPFDPPHTAYVWVDALVNYISALGYPDGELFQRHWPADVHLIGKDILWFHAVIWPCVLMALGLEPPKMIFAHGWWTNTGEKMSKSKGNFVDPVTITDRYGVDAYRYFLLREMPFGQDGDFSERALVGRIHNDLGNDLGNLLHRTLTMIEKYCNGVVPQLGAAFAKADDLRHSAQLHMEPYHTCMAEVQFSRALEAAWELIRDGNQYVEFQKPWELAKDPKQKDKLNTVMHALAATLAAASVALWPFMPTKMSELRGQLGLQHREPNGFGDDSPWADRVAGRFVAKGEPLFPKIEE